MALVQPPLPFLLCANRRIPEKICTVPGSKSCAACKLVSYCSKECQKAHWTLDQTDCKDHIRSKDWRPVWIRERRPPSFLNHGPPDNLESKFGKHIMAGPQALGIGLSLWGNSPAFDAINLAKNEMDPSRDFAIAFAASGDLRHVVKTVNGLPEDYSGHLKMVINDNSMPVVCRNVALLIILGTVEDPVYAADIALHFWYSTHFPTQYHAQISASIVAFLTHSHEQEVPFPVGEKAKISVVLEGGPPFSLDYFSHFTMPSSASAEEARAEYLRIRTAYSRRDFRDRIYSGLRPSHRAAVQKYQQLGIILPFGALDDEFDCANSSLFSLDGRWLQSDFADPLEGWDIAEVVEAGKKYGACSEDIYGCLYFFLSDQLRTFASRLRRFHITFTLLSLDMTVLAKGIRENVWSTGVHDLPSSIRFDRILVSNTVDPNYVGIRAVLNAWGPFLACTQTASIVAYFMNWTLVQQDGRAQAAGSSVVKRITKKLVALNKVSILMNWLKSTHGPLSEGASSVYWISKGIDLFYDNSEAFSTYLKKQGLDRILQELGLVLKKKNTVVPHVSKIAYPAHLNQF
ncbi:hypothetical protein FA15DRAFT_590857 [Coprinopsis marcescibilis]|uniref:MYND-type domain-containing protein n=1 Tax=Coprinopsis marcescibilis TaxID=230819 RepID=A0A5C3KXH9_COPMA|nr:hypothetical protein FA15DRAFT_590857 [Coprinopsis marcescibilis]